MEMLCSCVTILLATMADVIYWKTVGALIIATVKI